MYAVLSKQAAIKNKPMSPSDNKENTRELVNNSNVAKHIVATRSKLRTGEYIKAKICKTLLDYNKGRKSVFLHYKTTNSSFYARRVQFATYVNPPYRNSHSERRHGKKSILKKYCSTSKPKDRQNSMTSSIISTSSDIHQSVENINSNKVIWDKYERELNQYHEKHMKYTDPVYPPIRSSLYIGNSLMKDFCQLFEAEGKAIEWMRIPDVFPQQSLTIWNSNPALKNKITKGYISKTGEDSDYLPTCFNAIKAHNSLLERMFGSQNVNEEGLYIVKMHQTQTNIWKYVTVDDYIPVIVNRNLPQAERRLRLNITPAFLTVEHKGDSLYIWPFLLQKVYAKYYSTYDSLSNGITIDFMYEVSGALFSSLSLHNLNEVSQVMRHYDAILLAEDNAGLLHPLNNSYGYNNIIFYDRNCGFEETYLNISYFQQLFKKVHFAYVHKFVYSGTCTIKQYRCKEHKFISLQQNRSHHEYNSVKSHLKSPIILREFTITERTDAEIGLLQKEQRFFRAYTFYEYAWIRLILLYRSPSSDYYHWICGAYSNRKSIKLSSRLYAGTYTTIILPEWQSTSNDMNLVFFGNTYTYLHRCIHSPIDVLLSGCEDLAQRLGKMIQINSFLCSYNFIERGIGFVIENINSEHTKAEVKIVRSVEGLNRFGIDALNKYFLLNPQIEVPIAPGKSYTVVLKTSKGVDQYLLSKFSFDNYK